MVTSALLEARQYDHLFPWFLGLLLVLWVLPQLDGALPPGMESTRGRAPVPFAPLGVGRGMGVLQLNRWVGGMLPQAQKFREALAVMAFRGLPPGLLAFMSGMQLFPR